MSDKHAMGDGNGGEFTICGMAFDAYESGDADEQVVFAKPKEVVTCKECRAAIDYVKSAFTTDYRVRS